MANKEQRGILKQGVDVWNKWREDNPEVDIELSYANLSHANLSYANLSYANLSHANLRNARLDEADLDGADLGKAFLRDANLIWADLSKADLRNTDLRNTDLRNADLGKAILSKANLRGADLRKASLRGVNLREASLHGAILRSANLSLADIRETDCIGADLSKAILNKAILSKATLIEADLSMADLTMADLSEAILSEAILSKAILSKADLIEANLSKTDLSKAILSKADLKGAILTLADLNGANLREADLELTYLFETLFVDTDLSNSKGLKHCRHLGPSIIDHRTLSLSENLPIEFLRGCGLPDFMIDNIPVLKGNPIQFYSCFISYSSKDEYFAKRLHSDLQDNGIRCWFAPEDIKGGQKLHHQINVAIRSHEKLILILSEHSMKSSWVEHEIRKTREREHKEKAQRLYPIRLVDFAMIKDWTLFDADEGRDLAKEVREYFIPDFCNWKDHDSYKKAFDRLLKDLMKEAN